MTRALVLLVAALAALAPAAAQTVETGRGAVTGLPFGARNGVFVLDAEGGTLRAGPRLVEVAPDGTVSLPGAAPAFDPATAVDARVYALDARADVVVAALGFADVTADADAPPPTAAGFAVSTDGGRSYAFRFPALDQSRDTTVQFGVSTLRAVPATVPQGAAPIDLALTADADTVYAAALFAGLRRSTDDGATWERVVLPPDSLLVLDPRRPYRFVYSPDLRQPLGATADGQPAFPFASENFVAFSVLVDEAGTVWAGTNGGLNRSVRVPGATDPGWVRYVDSPLGGSIVGNRVFALEAQPDPDGRDDVWISCHVPDESPTADEEEFGVVVWRGDDAEGFAVFETVLLGVEVYDLAFDELRAYAASDDGLYISDDDGATWRVERTFRAADGRPLPIGPSPATFAVATTPGAVWAGTADGLLQSLDGGRTWRLFRADVPPAGADAGRDVEVYAYPNPFAPSEGEVRIRLDLGAPADVTVRVFDVAMNLVRTLDAPGRPAGPNEVFWDGRTDGGLRAANGAYIYVVEAGGRQLSGRILVID